MRKRAVNTSAAPLDPGSPIAGSLSADSATVSQIFQRRATARAGRPNAAMHRTLPVVGASGHSTAAAAGRLPPRSGGRRGAPPAGLLCRSPCAVEPGVGISARARLASS
jgi:hypothetical protein